MRIIDADALKEKINTAFLSEIGKLIDNAPTIDAVSVVRCGECKLGGTEDCPMDEIDDEHFCNFGEREGE